jgi:chlorobactene glucosyltransferase
VAARRVLTGAAALMWGAALAVAAAERGRVHDPAREEPAEPGPLVSVILPARDEARAVAAAVRSHLGQTYGAVEVILVDDESGDETAGVATEAAGGDPRFAVVDGAPVPRGWIGKSWACWQGVQHSRGEWLLFTDADVVHHPETLARCLALAVRLDRGGLTLSPGVDAVSVAERVVMPAAAALIQHVLAPGFLVRSRRSGVVMAAGAYLLVRRDVYDAFGGHAGISGRMVDDLAIAQAVKRGGDLLVPADGTSLIRLRMYDGLAAMWRGWRKNAAFTSSRDPSRGMLPAVALAALAALPAYGIAAGARRRDGPLAVLGLAGFAAQCALQHLAAPIVTTPPGYRPTLPLGAAFIAAAAFRGSVDRLSGRGPVWRGRRYPDAV